MEAEWRCEYSCSERIIDDNCVRIVVSNDTLSGDDSESRSLESTSYYELVLCTILQLLSVITPRKIVI